MNNITKKTLSNGLTVIADHNPQLRSASIGYFVKTGARDEVGHEAGVSHFLEHMMFKGTKKRNSIDLTYAMANLGAQSNAFTGEEKTVYYAEIISEKFSAMQEILTDMIESVIDPKEFEMEKKVILEEIALYKDKPFFYLYERATKAYYRDHPAGNSVLGSTESISAVTRDQMYDYFKRRYKPNNMALVASGSFNVDQFYSDAEALTSSWAKDDKISRTYPLFSHTPTQVTYNKKDLTQAHLVMMGVGPSAQDDEAYAFDILATILGDGSGSKTYWELVHTGIVDSAGIGNEEQDKAGVLSAYATCEPDKIDIVSKKLKEILSKPLDFSDAELERARTKLASRIALGSENIMSRMIDLGGEYLVNQVIETPKEVIERFKSVTRAEIEKALKKFPIGEMSEFRLLPQ
jgi:predicted Zn-dependent peptidase